MLEACQGPQDGLLSLQACSWHHRDASELIRVRHRPERVVVAGSRQGWVIVQTTGKG